MKTLVILLVLLLFPSVVEAGDTTQVLGRLNYYTDMLLCLAPSYTWGGSFGLLSGDCSGQMYWIFHRSGLPYIRTTAHNMWLGMWAGERNKELGYVKNNAYFPDLLFFTFTTKRPFGHVALVRTNTPTGLSYAEASFSQGYFKETHVKVSTKLFNNISGVLHPRLAF